MNWGVNMMNLDLPLSPSLEALNIFRACIGTYRAPRKDSKCNDKRSIMIDEELLILYLSLRMREGSISLSALT